MILVATMLSKPSSFRSSGPHVALPKYERSKKTRRSDHELAEALQKRCLALRLRGQKNEIIQVMNDDLAVIKSLREFCVSIGKLGEFTEDEMKKESPATTPRKGCWFLAQHSQSRARV